MHNSKRKKQNENFHEGITWSEMGKQNVQAKVVYSEMCQSHTPKTPRSPQKVYLHPKSNFTTLSFSEHHQKLSNILHQLFMKTVDVYFHCCAKKTIFIYFTISVKKMCIFIGVRKNQM